MHKNRSWQTSSQIVYAESEDCIQLGLRAGAILFRDVQVRPASPALRSEIASEVLAIRTQYASPAAVRATREVMGFREILRKVGCHPRREQPSVERLLAYALKRGDLPSVNNLVDAYNLVSIRALCSLGAHDFDTLAPPVALRLLTGRESFRPLGHAAEMSIAAGEYGYVDANDRVLCRLDVLQADFSKVTAATGNALLIIEGTTAHPAAAFRRAFADAIDVVTRHCGGEPNMVCPPPGLPVRFLDGTENA
jgi:DNA/RNA-binding domain of Phe-tRNA-synthetase-like protein